MSFSLITGNGITVNSLPNNYKALQIPYCKIPKLASRFYLGY
jgi:hypothetical protein